MNNSLIGPLLLYILWLVHYYYLLSDWSIIMLSALWLVHYYYLFSDWSIIMLSVLWLVHHHNICSLIGPSICYLFSDWSNIMLSVLWLVLTYEELELLLDDVHLPLSVHDPVGVSHRGESWWVIMGHDESWWVMMSYHDESWWVMMSHDESSWVMSRHDESSWCEKKMIIILRKKAWFNWSITLTMIGT